MNIIGKHLFLVKMAIRFCKGKEIHICKQIELNKNVFNQAANIFNADTIEYIPVVDRYGKYICSCYNDSQADQMLNHILSLASCKYYLSILANYDIVQIVGLNELSWQWAQLCLSSGCKVILVGEFWEDVIDATPQILFSNSLLKNIDGVSLFAEGNEGLPLSDLGYFKRTFPSWEYDFIEDDYKLLVKNKLIYNEKWKSASETQIMLGKAISSDKPFMAARLGNTEAYIASGLKYSSIPYYWVNWLYRTSGFFSKDNKISFSDVINYAQLTIESIKKCDYNLCRFESEIPLLNQLSPIESYNLDWYDTYLLEENNWTNSLINKKVLIISSISQTIEYQLRKRVCPSGFILAANILFYSLPETYFVEQREYLNWFATFEIIKEEISLLDYDIAIIAGGAYGYPLAAFIKDCKKQSIDICSGIYPLFKIKNNTQSIIRRVSSLYNSDWIFPKEKKSSNTCNIERAAYWE